MASLSNQLQQIVAQLSAEEQQTLLAFAEFLLSRSEHAKQQAMASIEPLEIARPLEESVVAAMRRLSKTYPMLEMDGLLHEAAGLMSSHVMQGRAAVEVIDDLQVLFTEHYQRFLQNRS